MPGELDRICKMLDEGAPEVQAAAAVVLGELNPKDGKAKKSLVGALKSSNDNVRLRALEALAKIDSKEALPHIVPLLAAPPAVRSRAISIVAQIGEPAAKLLKSKLEKAEPELRKGILEALGQLKGEAGDALFDALLDPDIEVVKQATQALRQKIDAAPPSERSVTTRRVLQFLDTGKAKKERSATVAGLKLLGFLRDPAGMKALLARLDRKEDAFVRSNALHSLANLELSAEEGQKILPRILPLLEDPNFGEVVQPALNALYRIKIGKDQVEAVRNLIKNPHPQVRLYSVKALGAVGSAVAARALVDALYSDDPEIAETASISLRSNAAFAPVLIKALGEETELPKAWKISNVLRTYRDVFDKKTLKQFVTKAESLIDKREPRSQVYFEILRGAAPAELRAALLMRGRDLLAGKKFADAERFLKLLARDDLATPESDYALATAGFQQQRKDLASAGRASSSALDLFSKLARRGDFPLLSSLEKDSRSIGAADLLYLGFAFIERQGVERDFGAGVLKLVTKKFGSSQEAKIAQQKLKTQGTG